MLQYKKSATKVFQVCVSIVYVALFLNFALALVLALHCVIVEIT